MKSSGEFSAESGSEVPKGDGKCQVPGWLLEVIADPVTRERLQQNEDGSLLVGPEGRGLRYEGGVLYLLPPPDVAFSPPPAIEWIAPVEHQQEQHLRPSQRHFRRLLSGLTERVPLGATVVDIASNDGEFSQWFPGRRYCAIDLLPQAIEAAIALGRIQVGIVGDVRMPPLGLGVCDVVVSTSTLHHVAKEEAVAAVRALLLSVRPSGLLAVTLPASWYSEVHDCALSGGAIREVRFLRNALVRVGDRLARLGRARPGSGSVERKKWFGLWLEPLRVIGRMIAAVGTLPVVQRSLGPKTVWLVVERHPGNDAARTHSIRQGHPPRPKSGA